MKTTAYLTLLLLLGSVVLLVGCSANPTEPTGNDPPDIEEPIATATIGAGGGTIDAEGISLSIPAGAFTADETISLFRSQESKPFGTDQITDEFRVEGLPADCAEGFEVRFAHSGNPEDSCHVALGQDAMDAATGDTVIAYDLLSTANSSGILICDVPGWSSAESPKTQDYLGEITFRIIGVSKYVRLSTEGGVEPMQYDLAIPPGFHAADMMALVDNAHLQLVNMGFKGVKIENGKMLQIRIENVGSEGARFLYRNRDRSSYILLDREEIKNPGDPALKIAAAQAVLRWILFSYTYDPYYPVMVGPNQRDYQWLHEATIAWVGEKFAPASQQATYIPPGFAGNEETPFDGIQVGVLSGSGDYATRQKRHGQGMAPLIKHLAEKITLPDGVLSPTHILAHRGQLGEPVHPVQALDQTFGTRIRDIYPVFMTYYTLGHYYGVDWRNFVEDDDVSGFANIDEERDTLATFRTTYPDVSARRYRINLQYDNFPENTTIGIKLKTDIPADDLKIYAYKILGETMSQIATGNKSVEIPNVKALRDEFADIFFLVVNSSYHAPEYVTVSDIDIEVRVQSTRELDFKNCTVYLQVEGNYRDTYFGDSWTETATITGSAIGSFTENRFSGAWDPAVHGAALGGINIRMNSQGTVIEELVFAYDITYATGSTYTMDIRANDLPFIQVTPWGKTQYGIEGWRTLDLVEEAEDWHIYGADGEWRMGFDTFESNATSHIFVEFN